MRSPVLVVLGFGLALGSSRTVAQQSTSGAPSGLHASNPALGQAEQLIQEGKFAAAETVLREDLRTDAQDADALYALAYCLLRQNRGADALGQYTAAAAVRPPNSSELVNVGQAYVLLGDDADADKWTLRAVRADTRNPQAWYGLGRIRYTEQRFAEAAACFGRVLSLSPRNVKAENNLGLAYEGQNRTDDAVQAYRQAIAWQAGAPPRERSEQPLLNLAIVLLHRGATAEAEPLLAQAEALAPADPHVHEQLGHLYQQQAKFDAAAEQFEHATAEDPKNASFHFLLGQAYRHLGKTEAAQRQFAAAARLAQPSPAVR